MALINQPQSWRLAGCEGSRGMCGSLDLARAAGGGGEGSTRVGQHGQADGRESDQESKEVAMALSLPEDKSQAGSRKGRGPSSQCKLSGPYATLASASRPVGSSRRLRSEGRRSNSCLGSSECSGLQRGRGGRQARISKAVLLACEAGALPFAGKRMAACPQNEVWHVYPGVYAGDTG